MKQGDKEKLNACLEILDTTDLGLSLVWLWTWSTIKEILGAEDWRPNATEDEAWEMLCKAVASGHYFSLEFGAEQHYDEIFDWMVEKEMILEFEDEDERLIGDTNYSEDSGKGQE